MSHSPFKFLDSYTKDDKDIFFGREREVEELYHRVFEGKIMLVYGVSGTGKSSLIHCGLANKFQDADWLPVNIRRAGDMVRSMAFAINQVAITPLEGEIKTPAQFKKAVRSLYLDHYKPIFFIFDQFEELFIFGNKEEKKEFIQIVKALTDGDLQCRFMFVLREEYLAGITEFEKVIPTILANRVRIERMTLANAKQVIEGPCKVFGIEVEEGFSDEMLEKLSLGSAEVELTYLQVYLDKVYRTASFYSLVIASEERAKQPERSGARRSQSVQDEKIASQSALAMTFSKKILGELGEVKDLLGSFLDEQIELLPDPDSALAVLKSFVSVKGTKRQMSPDEVQDYAQTLGKPLSESTLQELLQTLIQLRILRDKDQNNRYELRHDALATKIYEKITLVEKELLEVRNFIENAYENYRRRNILLPAIDLNYIAPYEDKMYLSGELKHFVEQSKSEIWKAKRRKIRLTLAASIVLFAFITGFAMYSYKAMKEAELQAKIEKSIQLANASLIVAESDPTLAYLLGEKAHHLYPTFESRKALVSSYLKRPFYNTIDGDFFIVSESGSYVVSYEDTEHKLRLYNYLGEQLFYSKKFTKPILLSSIRFLQKERFLSAISVEDSLIQIFSIEGEELFSKKIYDTYEDFDPNYYLNVNKENQVVYFNKNGFNKFKLSGEIISEFDLSKKSILKYAVDTSLNAFVILYIDGIIEIRSIDSFEKTHKTDIEIEQKEGVKILISKSNVLIGNNSETIIWNEETNGLVKIPTNKNDEIDQHILLENSFAHISNNKNIRHISIFDFRGKCKVSYKLFANRKVFFHEDSYLIPMSENKTLKVNGSGEVLDELNGLIIEQNNNLIITKTTKEERNVYSIYNLNEGKIYENTHKNDISFLTNNLLFDKEYIFDFKQNRVKFFNPFKNSLSHLKELVYIETLGDRKLVRGFSGKSKIFNLNQLLSSIEDFSFGEKDFSISPQMCFSNSNRYIIAKDSDSLILYDKFEKKISSAQYNKGIWLSGNAKFSNTDQYVALINHMDYYEKELVLDVFNLPDLELVFSKQLNGVTVIDFSSEDDTLAVYSEGMLYLYSPEFKILKENRILNIYGYYAYLWDEMPQINYPFISGIIGNRDTNRFYAPSSDSAFVIFNFVMDTVWTYSIAQDIKKAYNKHDPLSLKTLFQIFTSSNFNKLILWKGYEGKLQTYDIEKNIYETILINQKYSGGFFLKDDHLIFLPVGLSISASSYGTLRYQSKGIIEIYNSDNFRNTTGLPIVPEIGIEILSNTFFCIPDGVKNNLYDYDYRLFLTFDNNYRNFEVSHDGKYLIMYSRDESRIRKVPLDPNEIIVRVRAQKEFGKIRDFTEREKDEYQIR
jgi:hypothetical protein